MQDEKRSDINMPSMRDFVFPSHFVSRFLRKAHTRGFFTNGRKIKDCSPNEVCWYVYEV